MALPKRKFRELLFLILFNLDAPDVDDKAIQALLMKELSVTKKNVLEAWEIATSIRAQLTKIDEIIQKHCQSYELHRMTKVEVNLLRLGTFEIVFEKEHDAKIVISEAMRLADKFSTKEGATFLNAILDQIAKNQVDE